MEPTQRLAEMIVKAWVRSHADADAPGERCYSLAELEAHAGGHLTYLRGPGLLAHAAVCPDCRITLALLCVADSRDDQGRRLLRLPALRVLGAKGSSFALERLELAQSWLAECAHIHVPGGGPLAEGVFATSTSVDGDATEPPPDDQYEIRTDPNGHITFEAAIAGGPGVEGQTFVARLESSEWAIELFRASAQPRLRANVDLSSICKRSSHLRDVALRCRLASESGPSSARLTVAVLHDAESTALPDAVSVESLLTSASTCGDVEEREFAELLESVARHAHARRIGHQGEWYEPAADLVTALTRDLSDPQPATGAEADESDAGWPGISALQHTRVPPGPLPRMGADVDE